MPIINSVTGPIDSSQLGLTLTHEHLRVRTVEVATQFPHLYDQSKELQLAKEQVRAAGNAGIRTICDPTVMGQDRDIAFIREVSECTGVTIIAATGMYTCQNLPEPLRNKSIDYIAELFIRDIEVGIQNTDIKAGFIKCATDVQGVTPDVEKIIRAAARAHMRTGVPIMTHTHAASRNGLDQLDLLEDEGVSARAVIIGHSGDTCDMDYLSRLLNRQAYLGIDRFGLSVGMINEERPAMLLKLIQNGYHKQLLISQDYCGTIDWWEREEVQSFAPDWSMTHITSDVLPYLSSQGVGQDILAEIMADNVRDWFEHAMK
ncbi:phosphotriesterase family protein [Paenibacillus piscarius]|uniref:phosphotriesterase family protein n=1 Tax=Paenibacillus piscarius TaxID=1089681 RepID=UPI001EE9AB5D|nr:phosphotriesterase [Paenibacillus piscarius]